MQDPYDFLDFKDDREHSIGMSFAEIYVEHQEAAEFKKKYPTLHKFEKRIVDQTVDKYSNKFVQKLGYRKAQWLPCVKILLGILFIFNVMACYARPDFITQLVIVMSVFFLTDNENISRQKFRLLPLLILISIVYDFVWLFFIQNLEKEGSAEGNLEA